MTRGPTADRLIRIPTDNVIADIQNRLGKTDVKRSLPAHGFELGFEEMGFDFTRWVLSLREGVKKPLFFGGRYAGLLGMPVMAGAYLQMQFPEEFKLYSEAVETAIAEGRYRIGALRNSRV